MSASLVSSTLKNSWPSSDRQVNILTVTHSSFSSVCFDPSGSMKWILKLISSLNISFQLIFAYSGSKWIQSYLILVFRVRRVQCLNLLKVDIWQVYVSGPFSGRLVHFKYKSAKSVINYQYRVTRQTALERTSHLHRSQCRRRSICVGHIPPSVSCYSYL